MENKEPKPAPHILVVDDDFTSLLLYQESLEPAGFVVDEADSGSSAIKKFQQVRPDLIIMDVIMPVMNGYEACAEIRKLPGGMDVPIIMVTGLDDLDSISTAYEAGATDFITKPLNWPILRHRLFYILRANSAILALRKNEELLTHAQRIAHLGSWEWVAKNKLLTYSAESARMFNLDELGDNATLRDFIHTIHAEDRPLVFEAISCLNRLERHISIEHRILTPDNEIRYINLQIELLDDGTEENYTGTVQDITESKRTEDQIRKLAYYDALTGLPNRRLFRTQLERAIDCAARDNTYIALLFIDLDNFKQINDSLGHDAGDQLLSQFAVRLKQSTRKSDYPARNNDDSFRVEMSRLGGDEFTVMLTSLRSEHDVGYVAQRLIDNLQAAFTLNGVEVFTTASIGISLFPNDGNDMETLIKCADIAMYHAKAQGRNSYRLYDKAMNESVENRLNMENKIRNAIDNNEFEIYYQPRIDTKSGHISGLEALQVRVSRWI